MARRSRSEFKNIHDLVRVHEIVEDVELTVEQRLAELKQRLVKHETGGPTPSDDRDSL